MSDCPKARKSLYVTDRHCAAADLLWDRCRACLERRDLFPGHPEVKLRYCVRPSEFKEAAGGAELTIFKTFEDWLYPPVGRFLVQFEGYSGRVWGSGLRFLFRRYGSLHRKLLIGIRTERIKHIN